MATELAKATQCLTSAPEMRETSRMLMQPIANWEEYLTPAPLSIAILGELVFISSGTDFSINKNPPPDGFKYIRYPESFRACLMQVCNLGWHAFNEAHKNMDQIRLLTATVPGEMKEVINTLFLDDDEVIKALLPNQLENIRATADACLMLADGVEKKYSEVINIIQELLEACVNAENFYGEELETVKQKLKESKMRKDTAEEVKKQSSKVMENMEKQMEEAQDAYKKSMDSLPSGWDLVGMNVVEGLMRSVTDVLEGALPLISMYMCLYRGMVPNFRNQDFKAAEAPLPPQNLREEKVDELVHTLGVCSRSGEILSLATSLKKFINLNGIVWKELYDQKKKDMKTEWQKSQFQRISQDLETMTESKLCERALCLCSKGIDICNMLAKYCPNEELDDKDTELLIREVQKLFDDARTFDCKSKETIGSPALALKPPMMFKVENNTSRQELAGQMAAENTRFRIEQSREQLKQTRESYEKSVENMEKTQRELTDILVEMESCKIKEIDFNTTIKMLVKGLDAMGRVKEQWEKMVVFFQMVSNIVKCSLGKTIHNFVKTADATKTLSYNGKLFAKDLLYVQAFQASNIAHLVHMISETYTKVSEQYLMDRVSSLSSLMAMDKANPKFLQERLKLEESCREAQRGILSLVQQNKTDFERKTEARMERIERELMAVLPAAEPEETKRVKEIVQSGFGEGQELYY